MRWIVVNVVSSTEYVAGVQEYFPVEEELMLFCYKTKNELLRKIRYHFKLQNEMDGLYLGENPARIRCRGIRKATLISESDIKEFTIKNVNGIRVSRSKFKAPSLEDIEKLIDEVEVSVVYMEEEHKFDIIRNLDAPPALSSEKN